MAFLCVFLSSCHRYLLPVAEIEHPIRKDVRQLTRDCDKKNLLDWLEALSRLQIKLYDQASAMSKDEFEQHFVGKNKDSNEMGDLYWPYMLYGAPFITLAEEESMLSNMAASCYVFFYEFKESLANLDYETAEDDLNSWQSCLWTWDHKMEPVVDDFQACYHAIPKE